MLTAAHYQISAHEARHAAAAIVLGATVYVVEREGKGAVHGQVLFTARTAWDKQAILLAPIVHDFGLGSEDFPVGSYAVDIIEAARNAPLLAGIEAAREVVKRPDYQELARRISRRLITQPVLGPEDLEQIGAAS